MRLVNCLYSTASACLSSLIDCAGMSDVYVFSNKYTNVSVKLIT